MIDNYSTTNVKRTRTLFYVMLDGAKFPTGRPPHTEWIAIEAKLGELLRQSFAMMEAYSRPHDRLRLGEIVDQISDELTSMRVVYCSPHAEEFARFKHEYQLHNMFSVTVVVK